MQAASSASTSARLCKTSRIVSRTGVRAVRVVAKEVQADAARGEPLPSTTASSTKAPNGARRVRLSASKSGAQGVTQLERTLAEYMALPASQYSVLDARKIERIDDDTFRCFVGELRFGQWAMEPVLTCAVVVEPEAGGCTIKLLSCELRGSKSVEELNDKFSAQMSNVVRWRLAGGVDGSVDGRHEIMSTTSLEVDLEVPAWCGFIQTSSIEGLGSGVLQNVLNVMVPSFLGQLRRDYTKWAAGDASRSPVGDL
ncbi:hypothetical protein FOA52_012224 [Chlamydomonas sp. UWO 241]|nr:hypothetical protein FOA52_012224 [Chlamydomonas sp. UWO 241]